VELLFLSQVFRWELVELRPLVTLAVAVAREFSWSGPVSIVDCSIENRRTPMGKGHFWLIGIPIPIILLLWIFGFLH
jgi:hypothetical protein